MYDIIIVGGGPAGMTAALYALRGNKKVLILEKSGLGGKITDSNEVENYPAIKSISGKNLAESITRQINFLDAECVFEKVKGIERDGKTFLVNTSKNSYPCKSVILSVGTKPKGLGLKEEERYVGAGVSYCALCDGGFFRGQPVAVVGGGNTALHDAAYLAAICKKVYLIHLGEKLTGEKRLIERVRELDNVEIIPNSSVTAIKGDGRVEQIEITGSLSNKKRSLDVAGIFIAVGSLPQSSSFENIIPLDENGYALTDEECETEVKGIFAAGDCRKKSVRQLTTAVSDGTLAAVNAMNYIDSAF